MSSNQSVTPFSTDGHLLQVEYAHNSVKLGSTAVGIRGSNCVVLALEERPPVPQKLMWCSRRIFMLDTNIMMTYAGMTPDARVLVARAKQKCLKLHEGANQPLMVKTMTQYIADLKAKHTKAPDCRCFGVACLLGGFDPSLKARLYQTDPCGDWYEYNAVAIGRYAQTAQQYLDSNYREYKVSSQAKAIKMAISTLLQVAHQGHKFFEVSVLRMNNEVIQLDRQDVAEYVLDIEEGN